MPRHGDLLMLEGKNDLHVVTALCLQHRIPKTFDVKDYDGVEALLTALPERLEESDRSRLGLIIDADAGVGMARRWQAVRDRLISNGYAQVPPEPEPDGTIIPAPDVFRPKVGVWIMPDNRLDGMLEDFIQLLVPSGNVLLPRARSVVDQIPEADREFIPAHRVKAEIHTWLAWQERPGVPFGSAITERVLDGNSPAALLFVTWINRLFGPAGEP